MTDYTLDNPPPPELACTLRYVVGTIDVFGYVDFELRCDNKIYFLRYSAYKMSYLHPDTYKNNQTIKWLSGLIDQNNPFEIHGEPLTPNYIAASIAKSQTWQWLGDEYND